MRGHRLERLVEGAEVGVVLAAVRERHVERASLLAEGVVLAAVEREREDARIVGEDRGRAVALVDVEVDDGGALGAVIAARDHDGHGEVVEDAEPLPLAAERVVRAAGHVPCGAVREGPGERGQRAAGRPARLVHQRLAPREPQPPDVAGVEGALAHGGEVRGVVHQREIVPRGAGRLLQEERVRAPQNLGDAQVLADGEAMLGREDERVAFGGDQPHTLPWHAPAAAGARRAPSSGPAARALTST